MLQQDQPEDFVIATGKQVTVRDFIKRSAAQLGLDLIFEGHGIHEVGMVQAITGDNAPALAVGDVIVKIDPRYFRPTEVETLLGDAAKARETLGWVPEITLDQLIEEMMAHDLGHARRHALLKTHGFPMNVSAE